MIVNSFSSLARLIIAMIPTAANIETMAIKMGIKAATTTPNTASMMIRAVMIPIISPFWKVSSSILTKRRPTLMLPMVVTRNPELAFASSITSKITSASST